MNILNDQNLPLFGLSRGILVSFCWCVIVSSYPHMEENMEVHTILCGGVVDSEGPGQ